MIAQGLEEPTPYCTQCTSIEKTSNVLRSHLLEQLRALQKPKGFARDIDHLKDKSVDQLSDLAQSVLIGKAKKQHVATATPIISPEGIFAPRHYQLNPIGLISGTNLESVTVSSKVLTSDDISNIFYNNRNIMTELNLIDCRFEVNAITNLIGKLKTYPHLTSINLNSSFLNYDEILPVLEALAENTNLKLKNLSLSNCQMADNCAFALAGLLEKQPDLEVLDFSNNFSQGPNGPCLAGPIYKVLASGSLKSLVELNCSNTSAQNFGVHCLAKFLQTTTELKRLNVSNIAFPGVVSTRYWGDFFESLKMRGEDPTFQLHSINLLNNYPEYRRGKNENAEKLGLFLQSQKELKEIRFDESFAWKPERVNNILTGLNLSESPLETIQISAREENQQQLIELLTEKKSLKNVEISGLPWNETVLNRITRIFMETPPEIERFVCSGYYEKSAFNLSQSYSELLCSMPKLTSITVSSFFYPKPNDIAVLFTALGQEPAPKIESLKVIDCQMPEASGAPFEFMLIYQTELKKLRFVTSDQSAGTVLFAQPAITLFSKAISEYAKGLNQLAIQAFRLNTENSVALRDSLASLEALEKLEISYLLPKVNESNTSYDEEMQTVITGIPASSLRSVNFTCCSLGVKSAEVLGEFMKKSSQLQSLTVGAQYSGTIGIMSDEGRNFLTPDSICPLLDGIQNSEAKLHKIDISGCQLTRVGFAILSLALKNHPTLETMVLGGIFNSPESILPLLDYLKEPSALQILDISDCDEMLDQQVMDALVLIAKTNKNWLSNLLLYHSFGNSTFYDMLMIEPWTDRLSMPGFIQSNT